MGDKMALTVSPTSEHIMIQRHIGNVLTIPSGIIVHGCNAQGVMRSGIARSIRESYPRAYQDYRAVYDECGLRVGQVIFSVVERDSAGAPLKIIANAITQEFHGRDPSVVYVDYEGLARCFMVVRMKAQETGLAVHFPLIGCGLGNGKWPEVSSRIEKTLGDQVEKHLWVLPGASN